MVQQQCREDLVNELPAYNSIVAQYEAVDKECKRIEVEGQKSLATNAGRAETSRDESTEYFIEQYKAILEMYKKSVTDKVNTKAINILYEDHNSQSLSKKSIENRIRRWLNSRLK